MKHLIIIDMQNDFVTGSLGTDEAKSIVKKVTEKFYHYLKRGGSCYIYTRYSSGKLS